MTTNQLYKNADIINIILLAWTLFFNAPVAVVSAQDVFICIFWHNLFARWSSRCTVSSLKFREGLSSFPSTPPRLSVSIGLLWRRENGEAGFDWPDWKTFTFQSLPSSPSLSLPPPQPLWRILLLCPLHTLSLVSHGQNLVTFYANTKLPHTLQTLAVYRAFKWLFITFFSFKIFLFFEPF